MPNFNHLISIIVPAYNSENLIAETLQSVKEQTYENWECLIINDGSTDGTEDILLKFCSNDSRFKYFKKENGGSSTSRNIGLKNATGDFIQFLDADDFLYPNKLHRSVEIFEKNPSVDIVVTSFRLFTSDIKNATDAWWSLKQKYLSFEEILFGWDKTFSIPPHCGLFRAKVFKNLSFNEDVRGKEDWIMWIEAFLNGNTGYYLDEALALFRVHKDSKTKSQKGLMKENLIKTRNYLITTLPEEYSRKFSLSVVEALNNEILIDNNKILQLQDNLNTLSKSESYKIGHVIVNILRKLTFR